MQPAEKRPNEKDDTIAEDDEDKSEAAGKRLKKKETEKEDAEMDEHGKHEGYTPSLPPTAEPSLTQAVGDLLNQEEELQKEGLETRNARGNNRKLRER